MSGKMYVQSFTASFTAGAGGTTPGGGGRRLLEAGPHRSLLQSNTANNESAIVVAGLNSACATTGRKLLQSTNGIEIVYACAPCPPTCPARAPLSTAHLLAWFKSVSFSVSQVWHCTCLRVLSA